MVALNIKNPRVVEMARQAASRAGTTQVAAIEAALEEYLRRLDEADSVGEHRKARAARTLAALRSGLSDDDRAAIRQAMEDMYDDAGLPVR